MANVLQPPGDPVELARDLAEKIPGSDFAVTTDDRFDVYALEHAAGELDFLGGRYYLDAGRALVIPHSAIETDTDKPVTYHDLYDVLAEGQMISYARLHVGRLAGRSSVRALCLAIDEAMLVSSMTKVDSDHMLFVPVLAVNTIMRTS